MAKALGIVLPIERGANGYFNTTTNIQVQVRSNLINLLLTQVGERLMQPDYGSNIKAFLFNNQLDGIQASVEDTVEMWYPYVQISGVQITQDVDTNSFKLVILYTLKIGNIPDSITLVF